MNEYIIFDHTILFSKFLGSSPSLAFRYLRNKADAGNIGVGNLWRQMQIFIWLGSNTVAPQVLVSISSTLRSTLYSVRYDSRAKPKGSLKIYYWISIPVFIGLLKSTLQVQARRNGTHHCTAMLRSLQSPIGIPRVRQRCPMSFHYGAAYEHEVLA